jgi:predicted RNase H-like HicB family nuclease
LLQFWNTTRIGSSPTRPKSSGANGQGHTQEEALKSLADAIDLILTDRRHDALHGLPADAIQTTVLVA